MTVSSVYELSSIANDFDNRVIYDEAHELFLVNTDDNIFVFKP